MTEERDYFRSIFYVALVWVLTMIFHQVIYVNQSVIRDFAPSLSYYSNSGFLTLFLAVIGSIIAWIKTGKRKTQTISDQKEAPVIQTKEEPQEISVPNQNNLLNKLSSAIQTNFNSKTIEQTSAITNISLIPKRDYLLGRIDELSSIFPITVDEFTTTISQGVVSYRRRKHLPREKRYRFEDFLAMSDSDYNQMCFMKMHFGTFQPICEDLAYIKGNDVPLYYELHDILDYFKTRYSVDELTLDNIRKEVIRHNWEMAQRELNRTHNSWRV